MSCNSDNMSYNELIDRDVRGCNSGPVGNWGGDKSVHLGVLAQIYAAFHRSTLFIMAGIFKRIFLLLGATKLIPRKTVAESSVTMKLS